MYERQSCFKITNDNWYPPYQIKGWHKGVKDQSLVEVSFMKLLDGRYRCCVWGADDYGLEFDREDRQTVWEIYLSLLEKDVIERDALYKLGFVRA